VSRTLSTALQNYLSTPGAPSPAGVSVFVMGDLYEFTSPVLGVDRFTSWNANVSYGGNTYTSGTVIPSRDRVRVRLGLDIDQLDMEVGHGGSAVFGSSSQTWAAAALSGALDGSTVKLYRAFFDSSAALVDAVLLFGGYVGEVQPRSASVRLTVESVLAKLRQQWPKVVLGAGCNWDLYSAGCGLTRPSTWDAKSTLAATGPGLIKVASMVNTGFVDGSVVVTAPTSSPLYGLSRTITSETASAGDMIYGVAPSWPSTPGAALTVKLTKGCDKRPETCSLVHANLKRFTGAPLKPPDAAGSK
jgi:hypothetical protein